MNTIPYTRITVLFTVLHINIFCLAITACDDDDEDSGAGDADTDTDTDADFECAADRDGWEQCKDGMVRWCHADGENSHFHWGANCADLGFECKELSESEAVCLDERSECTVGEFRCEDGTAYNCVDSDSQGYWAVDPCDGECKEQDGSAHCEEGSIGDFDPQDACDIAKGTDVEKSSVTTTFGDVFSEDYHAELDHKVEVTLPENEASYIHFPVFYCGEFVIFLDTEDVLDGILHRDETEMAPAGGTANENCSEDLPEHWHMDLEWDGEGAEGDSPVPYVIRFKALPSQTVSFVVMQKSVEEE